MDDEVRPGGGETSELDTCMSGALQRLSAGAAGKLLVADVGWIADHGVDAFRGAEEVAGWSQREEAGDPGTAVGYAELGADPFSGDADGVGIEIDSVEERGRPSWARPQVEQPAGRGLQEDPVPRGRIEHRLIRPGDGPGDHRLDENLGRIEGAQALTPPPPHRAARHHLGKHVISRPSCGQGHRIRRY